MGSHTNATFPTRFDREVERALEKEKLLTELKFYKERYEELCTEIANIPEALQEWGYVDFTVGKEKSVRLIKKPLEEPLPVMRSTHKIPESSGGQVINHDYSGKKK